MTAAQHEALDVVSAKLMTVTRSFLLVKVVASIFYFGFALALVIVQLMVEKRDQNINSSLFGTFTCGDDPRYSWNTVDDTEFDCLFSHPTIAEIAMLTTYFARLAFFLALVFSTYRLLSYRRNRVWIQAAVDGDAAADEDGQSPFDGPLARMLGLGGLFPASSGGKGGADGSYQPLVDTLTSFSSRYGATSETANGARSAKSASVADDGMATLEGLRKRASGPKAAVLAAVGLGLDAAIGSGEEEKKRKDGGGLGQLITLASRHAGSVDAETIQRAYDYGVKLGRRMSGEKDIKDQ